jgi:alkylhydroperoxidase family enzyme
MFTQHSIESAPPAARRSMTATVGHLGYLPAAVARLASSPLLLDGFLKLTAMFDATSLDPLAREVVVMTIATRNECHVCVAMSTLANRLTGAPVDDALLEFA